MSSINLYVINRFVYENVAHQHCDPLIINLRHSCMSAIQTIEPQFQVMGQCANQLNASLTLTL